MGPGSSLPLALQQEKRPLQLEKRPLHQGRRPLGSGRLDVAVAARARPTSSSRDQVLPVLPALAPLLPHRGLTRGALVAVGADGGFGRGAGGDTSLAFALLSAASTVSWCGAVGVTGPGVVALAELGLDLAHLVLTPRPGPVWPEVTAAFLDGMDAVLLRPPGPVRPSVARRLAARARERHTVLVVLAPSGGWPEGVDVRLTVQDGAWRGVGTGHGHLQGRRVRVVATGRRAATRATAVDVWLPDPSGQVTAPRDAPAPRGRAGEAGRTDGADGTAAGGVEATRTGAEAEKTEATEERGKNEGRGIGGRRCGDGPAPEGARGEAEHDGPAVGGVVP